MSSKLKTLQKRNLIFAALIVVLGVVVVLRGNPTVSAKKESLPKVFPEFNPDDARMVEISVAPKGDQPGRKLALQLDAGGRWVMESHYRYPLQAGASRLLDAISRARRSALVTSRVDTFDQYAGNEGWTDVTVLDSQGRAMVRFGLGNYQYPETFLRVSSGGQEQIIKASNIVPNVAATDVKSWIDTRIWPNLSASKMIRIDVEQKEDNRTITIVKRGESAADIEMGAPEADEAKEKIYWMASPEEADAKRIAVEDLAREFTGMLIEDIASGTMTAADQEKFGLKDPQVVVTFVQKDGEKVTKNTLRVGDADESGDNRYVQRSDAQWVFKVRSASLSRIRQNPEEFIDKPEPPKDEGGEGEKDGAAGSPDGNGKDASGDPDGGDLPAIPPPLPPEDPKKDEPRDPKKDGGD